MKKILMTLAVALLTSGTVIAQDDNQQQRRGGQRPDRKEMIQRRTDAMVKQFSLNDDQAKQLLELNTKYADQMQPRHGGPRGGRRGGPGMRERRDSVDGQTGATQQQKRPELTEEQKAKMEADRKAAEESAKAYDAELQKILTADQYKAYKEDQQKRGQRGPRSGGQRGPRQ